MCRDHLGKHQRNEGSSLSLRGSLLCVVSQESPCRQEAMGKKKAMLGQGKGKARLLATEWELIPSTKRTIHHGWVVESVDLRRTKVVLYRQARSIPKQCGI